MQMELPIVKEPSIWQGFQAFIPCWWWNRGLNKSVLHIESPRFLAQEGRQSAGQLFVFLLPQFDVLRPPLRQLAVSNTCSRFRLKARHTKHHSPAAAANPRSENWRKPRISLMMPMTGSTVHLRKP